MITIMWPCILANPIMPMVFTLVEVKQAHNPDTKSVNPIQVILRC